MNTKSTTERLSEYLNFKGLNNNQLTNLAGLSIGLIGTAISKNKSLTTTTIEKILYVCNDLSADWLLTGSGPMIKQSPVTGKDCTEKIDQLKEQLAKSEELVGLQRYQLEGFAREIKRLSTEIAALKKENLPTSHSKPMAP